MPDFPRMRAASSMVSSSQLENSRMTKPAKVAVVVSHPIQHFCPQYCSWAKLSEIHLKIIFASRHGLDDYHDRKFNRTIKWNLTLDFDHSFLPGASGKWVDSSIDSQDLDSCLDEFSPEAVICYGYSQKLQKRAMSWTKGNGRSLLMVSDSELHQHRGWAKSVLKNMFLPKTLSSVDAFLTVGDSNEAYYRSYGASDEKFIRTSFPIDINEFDAAYPDREEIRREIRERHEIPEGHLVVLMVGKLIEIKRQSDLIAAAARLKKEGIGISVIFAGTGDQENRMREHAACEGVESIIFLGFRMPEDLVRYYLGSDVYVHCSAIEPHSLAISEAIYAGLPIVVSDRCGSYGPTDDVRSGLNGFVYPCGDIAKLAQRIFLLAGSASLRRRMGIESRDIGMSNQKLAHGKALIQALEFIRNR